MFPEGRITEDGEIAPFRRGIERIVERTPVPVVPMALRGLWGSFFSRRTGSAMMRLRRVAGSKVALVAGSPVAPQFATPEGLQTQVFALRGESR